MRKRCLLVMTITAYVGIMGCSESTWSESKGVQSHDDESNIADQPADVTAVIESASPGEMILKNLMHKSLTEEFCPGKEIIVGYVEIPPNTTMDRHWHPGEEFQYYLEGRVEIAIDGQESIIGTPGNVGHVPFKKMHTAITGPEGAKLIVFRVHTAGESVRYLEQGGESDH